MRNLRAWDPSAKRMNDIRGYVDNKDTTKIFYAGMGGYVSYPKDKIVILEGTGEKDENKIEIFDGNILRTTFNKKETTISKVVFKDGGFFYVTKDEEGFLYYLTQQDDEVCTEIIGSIQEKPELFN